MHGNLRSSLFLLACALGPGLPNWIEIVDLP